jgi:RNA polymerase sigma-70 factor (ECF subfamily)
MLRSWLDRAFRRWRRTGDGRLLARVFDATAADLYRLGYHLLGDRHAAEDLVQHTFVVAIEQADSFEDRRGVVPWLSGILTHRALHLRRQQRQRAGKANGSDSAVDPVAEANARELQETVAAKVRALPEPYRQVLMLHLVHELTAQEVADALARPHATVRTQLARGLDLLRKALPASIGGPLLAGVPPLLALPALRAKVLLHAQQIVPANAAAISSGALAIGSLAMKKTTLAVLVGVLALVAWPWWNGAQTAPPPPTAMGVDGPPPATANVPTAASDVPVATSPRTEAPVAANAPAALEVAVAWHDGAPATDIAVRVTPAGRDGALGLEVARSGADGVAHFPTHAPGVVLVRTDRGNAAKVELAAGKSQSVQLTIPRGIDVHGRVVDSEAKPVADASVWMSVVPNSDESELAAISGADGTFAIRSAGQYHVVSATAAGRGCAQCAFVDERSANEELVVAVRSVPGVLVGTVVDDKGKPVAGARVLVGLCGWNQSDDPEEKRMYGRVTGADVWSTHILRSDADGHFRVDGLPPWPWPVWVGARGFGPLLRIVEIAEHSETAVTFALAAPAVVAGTVRDARGQPVANASIGANAELPAIDERITLGHGEAGAAPPWVATKAVTDATGKYTMRGVVPGKLRLGAWGQKEEARAECTITAGEVFEWNPNLAPPSRFEITGALVDDAGNPVRGFDVHLADDRGDLHVGSRDDGTFRILRSEDLPFRIAIKRAYPNAGRLVSLGEFRVADCPLRLVVPAAARRGATLRGRLLRTDGSPLTVGYMYVTSRDRRLGSHGDPDAGGNFVSGELDPGTYDAQVGETPFGYYGVGAYDLRAGECRDLGDITPPPIGELVVTAVDVQGHPRPDVWLRVRALGSDRMAGWAAKHNESVTRGVLPAGRYSLQTWEGPIAAMEVEVTAGAVTNARFVVPDTVPFVLRLPKEGADVDQLSHEWRIDDRLVMTERANLRKEPYDERHSAPPGRYTVEVRDPDGNLATATFDLRASEPPPVFELPLPRR